MQKYNQSEGSVEVSWTVLWNSLHTIAGHAAIDGQSQVSHILVDMRTTLERIHNDYNTNQLTMDHLTPLTEQLSKLAKIKWIKTNRAMRLEILNDYVNQLRQSMLKELAVYPVDESGAIASPAFDHWASGVDDTTQKRGYPSALKDIDRDVLVYGRRMRVDKEAAHLQKYLPILQAIDQLAGLPSHVMEAFYQPAQQIMEKIAGTNFTTLEKNNANGLLLHIVYNRIDTIDKNDFFQRLSKISPSLAKDFLPDFEALYEQRVSIANAYQNQEAKRAFLLQAGTQDISNGLMQYLTCGLDQMLAPSLLLMGHACMPFGRNAQNITRCAPLEIMRDAAPAGAQPPCSYRLNFNSKSGLWQLRYQPKAQTKGHVFFNQQTHVISIKDVAGLGALLAALEDPNTISQRQRHRLKECIDNYHQEHDPNEGNLTIKLKVAADEFIDVQAGKQYVIEKETDKLINTIYASENGLERRRNVVCTELEVTVSAKDGQIEPHMTYLSIDVNHPALEHHRQIKQDNVKSMEKK